MRRIVYREHVLAWRRQRQPQSSSGLIWSPDGSELAGGAYDEPEYSLVRGRPGALRTVLVVGTDDHAVPPDVAGWRGEDMLVHRPRDRPGGLRGGGRA